METFNNEHLQKMKDGKVISINESSRFSSVPMFKAFVQKDLHMNPEYIIVTYSGLTNFDNMYRATWKGVEGVDYFKLASGDDLINKMNELSQNYVN